jgi:hypothetical protein
LKQRLLAIIGLFTLVNVYAGDWRGNVEFEGSAFFENPAFAEQSNSDLSIAAQPEYLQEWNNGNDIFTFTPFYRIDQRDNNRTHGDLRELSWIHAADDWELLAGVGKVFWGVTEAVHLVDIVNQTDLVESLDGEEKLGQPMIDLSLIRDWGVVDLFVLPWFRERTFPSEDGRPRFAIPIDTHDPIYESSAEQHHVDFAARWSNSIGEWDIGLSYFYGTSREPRFVILPSAIDPVDGTVSEATPLYEIINQISIDLQAIYGSWLWKLEAYNRGGQGDRFAAAAGGFEYTFVGVHESAIDVGVIAEYLYDGRDDEIGSIVVTPGTPFSTSPFQNDLVLGTRLTFNDMQSTELLAVAIIDLEGNGQTFSLEASRRIGNDWVLALEGNAFSHISDDTSLASFKKDSNIRLMMTRYF